MPDNAASESVPSARLDPVTRAFDGASDPSQNPGVETANAPDSDGPTFGGTDPTADDNAASADSDPTPEERFEAFDRRLTAVEAELDAVRGLLDGVDAVDEAVERRASIALAKVEALERTLEGDDRGLVRERLPETDRGGARDRRPGDAEDGAVESRSAAPEAVDSVAIDGVPAVDNGVTDAVDGVPDAATTDVAADDTDADGSLASRLRDAFR